MWGLECLFNLVDRFVSFFIDGCCWFLPLWGNWGWVHLDHGVSPRVLWLHYLVLSGAEGDRALGHMFFEYVWYLFVDVGFLVVAVQEIVHEGGCSGGLYRLSFLGVRLLSLLHQLLKDKLFVAMATGRMLGWNGCCIHERFNYINGGIVTVSPLGVGAFLLRGILPQGRGN